MDIAGGLCLYLSSDHDLEEAIYATNVQKSNASGYHPTWFPQDNAASMVRKNKIIDLAEQTLSNPSEISAGGRQNSTLEKRCLSRLISIPEVFKIRIFEKTLTNCNKISAG